MVPVAAASDIAVLSSDNEGTPVSLIEAAAAATPAVSTDVGGVRDVVTADTGLIVPPGDHLGLGRALSTLAANTAGRTEMGARARSHVAGRFGVERLISDVGALYDELAPLERLQGKAPVSPSDAS